MKEGLGTGGGREELLDLDGRAGAESLVSGVARSVLFLGGRAGGGDTGDMSGRGGAAGGRLVKLSRAWSRVLSGLWTQVTLLCC